jgi:hypothetical protein
MNLSARRLVLFCLVLIGVLAVPVAPLAATPAPRTVHLSTQLAGATAPRARTRQQHALTNRGALRSTLPLRDASTAASPQSTGPLDLKVLVISADGNETDYPAIKAFLGQLGIPYSVLIGTQTQLTASMLWDGSTHGYYDGVILATGNLTYYNASTNSWQSAFNSNEWLTLWQYEALFNVRQLTSYTDPVGWPDTYGLNLVTYQDTTTTALQASLTAAGQTIFPYLQATSPVTFHNSWVYLATVADPTVTTPLLQTSNGYAIASIHTYSDGRQNLAVTAANNPYLTHSLLLSYGVVNWVTKGLFLGNRHVQIDTTVDDLFIEDNLWNTTTLSDTNDNYNYRINSTDLNALVAWQNRIQAANANQSGVKVEWAFNGQGTEAGYVPVDTLTPAVGSNKNSFNFISHTYTHVDLTSITAADTTTELTQNDQTRQSLALPNYWIDAFVQPNISGLSNPNFQQAAYNFGVRYMISDTSQAGWNNPSPNAGFYSAYQPGILIIPRHPTNLFYNLGTPAQWVSEYNCYYGPTGTCAGGAWRYWSSNLTYAQILDVESSNMLAYLLKWDIDPLMFHQTNVEAYDGVHSLYSDLMDAVLAKYNNVYNLPILDHPEHQLGIDTAQRMAYNASGVRATLTPCTSLTVTTTNAAVVPVTGVASGPAGTQVETYGGQHIAYLNLAAGQSVTVPVTC